MAALFFVGLILWIGGLWKVGMLFCLIAILMGDE